MHSSVLRAGTRQPPTPRVPCSKVLEFAAGSLRAMSGPAWNMALPSSTPSSDVASWFLSFRRVQMNPAKSTARSSGRSAEAFRLCPCASRTSCRPKAWNIFSVPSIGSTRSRPPWKAICTSLPRRSKQSSRSMMLHKDVPTMLPRSTRAEPRRARRRPISVIAVKSRRILAPRRKRAEQAGC